MNAVHLEPHLKEIGSPASLRINDQVNMFRKSVSRGGAMRRTIISHSGSLPFRRRRARWRHWQGMRNSTPTFPSPGSLSFASASRDTTSKAAVTAWASRSFPRMSPT